MRLTALSRSLLVAAALSILPVAAFGQGEAAKPRRFTEIVKESFDAWDKDRSGDLSTAELDRAVLDPALKGEPAAAAAAIKLIVRSGKYELPEKLTREYLANPKRSAEPEVVRRPVDDDSDVMPDPVPPTGTSAAPKLKNPDFQSRYVSSVKRIKDARRELFLDDTPDIDKCHQGPLGDCFFIAAVGAAVHRDSNSIKSCITQSDGGSYVVTFAGNKAITVPPLTDAQIAMTSRTGDEGLWLAVLESAFGSLRNSARPEDKRVEEATDAIAKGGSIGTSIRTLTGHEATGITLRTRAERASGDDFDAFLKSVREKLIQAINDKRLVGCSTGTDTKLPPGVSGKHAYAVLGFDADKDLVHIWNPHGNTFNPKGEPGIETGYVTKAGRFDVPLAEFVRIFRSLTLETDKAPSPRTRGRGQPSKPDAKPDVKPDAKPESITRSAP